MTSPNLRLFFGRWTTMVAHLSGSNLCAALSISGESKHIFEGSRLLSSSLTVGGMSRKRTELRDKFSPSAVRTLCSSTPAWYALWTLFDSGSQIDRTDWWLAWPTKKPSTCEGKPSSSISNERHWHGSLHDLVWSWRLSWGLVRTQALEPKMSVSWALIWKFPSCRLAIGMSSVMRWQTWFDRNTAQLKAKHQRSSSKPAPTGMERTILIIGLMGDSTMPFASELWPPVVCADNPRSSMHMHIKLVDLVRAPSSSALSSDVGHPNKRRCLTGHLICWMGWFLLRVMKPRLWQHLASDTRRADLNMWTDSALTMMKSVCILDPFLGSVVSFSGLRGSFWDLQILQIGQPCFRSGSRFWNSCDLSTWC